MTPLSAAQQCSRGEQISGRISHQQNKKMQWMEGLTDPAQSKAPHERPEASYPR